MKIKKGNEYPIGSEDIYVLGSNGQPTNYKLKNNEVTNKRNVKICNHNS